MKTSINNYLQINLVKSTPNEDGGFDRIGTIDSLDAIVNLNEVREITFGKFYSQEEADKHMALFPKSYKAMICRGHDYLENGDLDFDSPVWYIYFKFNFIYLDKTTGSENEAAMNRLVKVIKKIKGLM